MTVLLLPLRRREFSNPKWLDYSMKSAGLRFGTNDKSQVKLIICLWNVRLPCLVRATGAWKKKTNPWKAGWITEDYFASQQSKDRRQKMLGYRHYALPASIKGHRVGHGWQWSRMLLPCHQEAPVSMVSISSLRISVDRTWKYLRLSWKTSSPFCKNMHDLCGVCFYSVFSPSFPFHSEELLQVLKAAWFSVSVLHVAGIMGTVVQNTDVS